MIREQWNPQAETQSAFGLATNWSITVISTPACSNLSRFIFLIALLVLAASATAGADDPLRPPAETVLKEARSIVGKMIENPRGPYARLRWFCSDGTILPPTSYACQPHGGGRQHAEYSADRQRLAELGWHVGTVFAALEWPEFWDAGNTQFRLKELALERYLMEVSDDWVLRRAKDYRGRVQIEDEEKSGRALLLKLLADRAWLNTHFLLARETVRVVPHSGGNDLTRNIRRSAQDIAETDPGFESLRLEVHSRPSAQTAGRIRRWVERDFRPTEGNTIGRQASELANALDDLYGQGGRIKRLVEARKRLSNSEITRKIGDALRLDDPKSGSAQTARMSEILVMLRETILSDTAPATRLMLFDLFDDIEAELRISAENALRNEKFDRRHLLKFSRDLLMGSFGSGFLSAREASNTAARIDRLLNGENHTLPNYLEVSRALNRSVAWPVSTVRYVFAEPLTRYTALDGRASGFLDDMLRGSPVLMLAQATRILAFDAQLAAGVHRTLSGRPAPSLLALNPGLAMGRLRVFSDADLNAGITPARTDIVVLPQTVAELPPVAGVLTRGEGNLLSHVQLLARNFGIPNVAISGTLSEDLAALDGQEILLAVDSAGSVVIEPLARLDKEILASIAGQTVTVEPDSLDVPEPNLSMTDPIPLANLRRKLSGRVVGPKAANLGELDKLFPGKVAPAVALPFGLFNEHMTTGSPSLRDELVETYRARRENRIDEATLLERLAGLRARIAALQLAPEARKTLIRTMAAEFGDQPGYGLFIRSDTNVEDLPGFSGAGLSETIANVVGTDAQLAGIAQVWASVLSQRSVAWRANLMKNPERIYASVLLMQSVPADKSGVLVTTDLVSYGKGLTVSAAWGVGGAVAGEVAETLVLLPGGGQRLIHEAKAPFRRALSVQGGIDWRPAADGAVLTADEKRQLRELAVEVTRKYKPVFGPDEKAMPWDIEFGFVDGKLALFQIRPLVERGYVRAARVVRLFSGPLVSGSDDVVQLDDAVRFPEQER